MFMPLIAALVYSLMEVYKAFRVRGREKWTTLVPVLASITGGLLGLGWYYLMPDLAILPNVGVAVVMGIVSGLSATGGNQILKQMQKKFDTPNKEE